MNSINVNDKDIGFIEVNGETFISLTDLAKGEDGTDHIKNWMRNRNTLEYLGLWETINNPNFKGVEFDLFRNSAGLNSFTMSPQKWIEATNAKGIISKPGRNGGTYAHKDLALEFCTWLSPMFKLLVLKEFQRLKEAESKLLGGQWDARRFVSKVNFKIQTDAVKEIMIPLKSLPKSMEGILYAEASDIIYMAMFGYTSKQWREKNPELHAKGLNIRDIADTHQLIVLANLENLDAALMKQGVTDKLTRIATLRKEALSQVKILRTSTEITHEYLTSPHLAQKKSLGNSDSTDQKSPRLN